MVALVKQIQVVAELLQVVRQVVIQVELVVQE
jgi:hypothetical protein